MNDDAGRQGAGQSGGAEQQGAGQQGFGNQGPNPQQHPGYWYPTGPQQYPQMPHHPGYPPYGGPQKPPRKRNRLLGAGALGLAAALVAGSLAWGIDQRAANGSQLAQHAFDPAAVAAEVSPGLVNVNTVLGYEGAKAAGTGIVLTSDGEVLTNHHVIEGATSISVTDVGNGRTYTASVVGYNKDHDIAVLKLTDASGLQTAKIGESDKVAVGDQVVGIGNAGGVGGTPSYAPGEVTALNQSITATDANGQNPENLSNLIATSADIRAGDSGGPLANASGEVIAVDTAGSAGNNGGSGRPGQAAASAPISAAASTATSAAASTATSATTALASASATASPAAGTAYGDGNGQNGGPGFGPGFGNGGGSGNGQGQADPQGFAIPINQAMKIADQIEAGKASDTVHIGESAMLGVSVLPNAGTTGAVVGDVLGNGKADDAGIEAGDVITSFAGEPVDSPGTLSQLLDEQHPGDKVEVGWADQSGQQHKATIELITGPVR
ncbi:trypsin-like serine protease [Kribbella turkmenica]|uniref:Trypsin-like serine protease n=1 Tax=Kribbella turkmenica TaxID=2530375 RepID=A0A4R4XG71_9ACTN|nr:trypsin-like peptidase domain-containing protein [Kribbella turkmenica]TDD29803.1 trypsin-like serine protease [Kribbella turkmenica]